MSKAKDRARAEAGLIFRDGRLVRKEDWYKDHPKLQHVIEAAKAEIANRPAVTTELPYYCAKCSHQHKPGTKIHAEHIGFAVIVVSKG